MHNVGVVVEDWLYFSSPAPSPVPTLMSPTCCPTLLELHLRRRLLQLCSGLEMWDCGLLNSYQVRGTHSRLRSSLSPKVWHRLAYFCFIFIIFLIFSPCNFPPCFPMLGISIPTGTHPFPNFTVHEPQLSEEHRRHADVGRLIGKGTRELLPNGGAQRLV